MDALALLCTLHGDGPATLKRLRRAGCATLQDVERHSPEELAGILAVTPSAARRFGRESRHLIQRMEDSTLDREEGSEPGLGALAESLGSLDLGHSERSIMSSVLGRWKQKDEAQVLPGETTEFEPEVGAVDRGMIAPGAIDGLDEELSRALANEGVRTVEELVAADGLHLAGALAQPFAVIRRLQFIARRSAGGSTSSSPAVERGASISVPMPAALPGPLDSERAETPLGVALARARVEQDPPGAAEPQAVVKPTAAGPTPAGPTPAGPTPAGETVLNWNFEIPTATAPPGEDGGGREDPGGPFA